MRLYSMVRILIFLTLLLPCLHVSASNFPRPKALEPAVEFCRANYELMQAGELELIEVQKFVWGRHVANKHKHEAPFVVNVRDILK